MAAILLRTAQPIEKHPLLLRMNLRRVSRPPSNERNLSPLKGAPKGFLFEPEIMTPTEEAVFLDVKALTFEPFRTHGLEFKRRVVRFGIHYMAGSAAMMPASTFPLFLEPLRDRAAAAAGVPTRTLSGSLITEYPSGAGIGWHWDWTPFGIVVDISFGGNCRMRFRRGDGKQRQTWSLALPPRSLYVMSGIALEKWQRSIPLINEPRWSITFRRLKNAGG